MYAIIDRSKMTLVSLIHGLENPTPLFPFVLINLDEGEPAFRALTTLEAKLLYRNLGQVPGTVITNRVSVVRAILKLIKYRPVTDAAQMQLLPAQSTNGIPLPAATRNDPSAANAVAPAQASKGAVRATIWEVADRMWHEAGKPTEAKQVLALRKSIMEDLLHVSAIKKTTSSNELGTWAKVRVTAQGVAQ